MDVRNYERYDYIVKSTDQKPNLKSPNDNGALLLEVDTNKVFMFFKGEWYEHGTNGGGSGGSMNYTEASNKPSINGNTLIGNKSAIDLGLQPYKHEDMVVGWTRITMDTDEDIDIRPQIENGYSKFTILVYIRKGNVRQGVKYELTAAELQKIGSKVQKNMVCITRTCIDPSGSNAVCTVKQCVTANQDAGGNPIFGFMKIKYNLYDAAGTPITTTLDNFEYCMYAE